MYKLAVCSLFCVFALTPAASFAEVGVGVSVGDDHHNDGDHHDTPHADVHEGEHHDTPNVDVHESDHHDAPHVDVHHDDAPRTDVHGDEHK